MAAVPIGNWATRIFYKNWNSSTGTQTLANIEEGLSGGVNLSEVEITSEKIVRTEFKFNVKFGFSNGAAKGGMSEVQLLTRAVQKAEAAIGGSGGVAGTLKHTYAKNL